MNCFMNAYLAKMTQPMSRTRIYDNRSNGYREWWRDGKCVRSENGILHCKKRGKDAWGNYPDVPQEMSKPPAKPCRKLERARVALQIILTWAKFRNGEAFNRVDVLLLVEKTLREMK